MQHYRNVDNTMRAYPEITANWAEAGITADKWVAFYCGTGWRASETWFYAYLQGWQRIAVYDGGWFEWSQDPVATRSRSASPTRWRHGTSTWRRAGEAGPDPTAGRRPDGRRRPRPVASDARNVAEPRPNWVELVEFVHLMPPNAQLGLAEGGDESRSRI